MSTDACSVSTSPPPRGVRELLGRLRAGGRTLVAMSGGVDSSLVASLVEEALAKDAFAVTLVGPSVSAAEVDRARRVAREIGIQHELVPVDPLAIPEYRANPANRCFFCRTAEADVLRTYGAPRDIRTYLDGVHVDDLGDDRPGLRAMERAGFDHPFVWARWSKAEVRRHARMRGLSNWDLPSDACLASRIPHGQPVSRELLDRIERAERVVLDRGFRRVRVRVDGAAARVVVDPHEVGRLTIEPISSEIVEGIRALGFDPVILDPVGYRSRAGA